MVGLFLGAAATALAIVIVGSLLRAPLPPVTRQVVVALVAVVLIVREFGLLTFPVPQNARLVSQFVTRVPFWGALQFGAEMGTGMRTFSPTGLPHVIVAAVLLLASWPAALLAGVGFALGRALMVVSFVLARDKDDADAAFVAGIPRLRTLLGALMLPLIALVVVT